jgi:hypothetical protein
VAAFALGVAAMTAALAPAPAFADQPGLTATLPPYSYAGFQSHLIIADVGDAGGLTPHKVPGSMSLLLAPGFKFDPQAVSATCSTAQANDQSNDSCPKASRIARGSIDVTIAGLVNGSDTATVAFYAMAPQASGDIAGVAFHFFVSDDKNSFQYQGTSIGHLKPLTGDPMFGDVIQFDKLPVPQVPPGIDITLNNLKLDLGAPDLSVSQFAATAGPGTQTPAQSHRKHAKAKPKSRRAQARLTPSPAAHSFLTNPPSCGGSWAIRVAWGYSDGQRTADAGAPCTTAPPS